MNSIMCLRVIYPDLPDAEKEKYGICDSGAKNGNKNDMPKDALHWENYLEHIIEKCNKIYRVQMPKVTPHVCRHTFALIWRSRE